MISEYCFFRIITRNHKSTISRKNIYRRRCVNGFAVEYENEIKV